MSEYFKQNYFQRKMKENVAKDYKVLSKFAEKGDSLIAWMDECIAWGRVMEQKISLHFPDEEREMTWKELFQANLIEIRVFGQSGVRIAHMVREDRNSNWHGRTLEQENQQEFLEILKGQSPEEDTYLTLDYTAWMWGYAAKKDIKQGSSGQWSKIDIPKIRPFYVPTVNESTKQIGLKYREFFRVSTKTHTLVLEDTFPVEII